MITLAAPCRRRTAKLIIPLCTVEAPKVTPSSSDRFPESLRCSCMIWTVNFSNYHFFAEAESPTWRDHTGVSGIRSGWGAALWAMRSSKNGRMLARPRRRRPAGPSPGSPSRTISTRRVVCAGIALSPRILQPTNVFLFCIARSGRFFFGCVPFFGELGNMTWRASVG